MNQPNQSELRELVDDSVLTHTGRSIGDISSGHVARELEAYITANYTPINQPSTKITPVTDGVGGSESTNQSEHKEVK